MADGPAEKPKTLLELNNEVKALLPQVFGKPGTMSDTELVDALYAARAFEGTFKARGKLLGEVLTQRNQGRIDACTREEPSFTVAGTFTPGFEAVKVWQKRLDTEAIEAEMGADWVEDHKKEIDFVQFKSIKSDKKEG